MPRADPLDTLLNALLALALTAGIALAVVYVPHEVCYADPLPGGGLITECYDRYGWAWELDSLDASVYGRPYAVQLSIAGALVTLPILIGFFRRRPA